MGFIGGRHTSEIIIWQSNVPFPCLWLGFATCDRIFVTTGAPNVMLGTKWPSICFKPYISIALNHPENTLEMDERERGRTISTCSQSAPAAMVSEHAFPSSAKSAERIEGAIMAGGDIVAEGYKVGVSYLCVLELEFEV